MNVSISIYNYCSTKTCWHDTFEKIILKTVIGENSISFALEIVMTQLTNNDCIKNNKTWDKFILETSKRGFTNLWAWKYLNKFFMWIVPSHYAAIFSRIKTIWTWLHFGEKSSITYCALRTGNRDGGFVVGFFKLTVEAETIRFAAISQRTPRFVSLFLVTLSLLIMAVDFTFSSEMIISWNTTYALE